MILDGSEILNTIEEKLKENDLHLEINNVNYGGFLFTQLERIQKYDKNIIIVENKNILKNIYNFFKNFEFEVYEFDENDIVFFENYVNSKDIDKKRIEVIYKMLFNKKINLITTVDALFSPTSNLEKYKSNILKIQVGQELKIDKFIDILINIGYKRESIVESFSNFCVKGNIVDLFSPMYDNPIRIEFFGDYVENIRFFYADTQIKIDNVLDVLIYPAKEGLLFEDKNIVLDKIRTKIINEKNDKIKLKYINLLEKLEENCEINNLFLYSNIFYEKCDSVFDYCKNNNFNFSIWNFQNVLSKLDDGYKFWKFKFNEHFLKNEVFREQIDLKISKEKFLDRMSDVKFIAYNSIFTNFNNSINNYIFKDIPYYNKKINIFLEDLKRFLSQNYKIIICLKNKEKIEILKNLFYDYKLKNNVYNIIDKNDIDIGRVEVGINFLILNHNSGFIYENDKIVLFTEYDIYGNSKETTTINKKNSIKSFNEIEIGDYVVHTIHGIGKYEGVVQLVIDNEKKDYLKICYRNSDVLYLEVEKLNNLQKYIFDDTNKVKLNKLGSVEWKNTKLKVKKEIEEIQEELVKLYAIRKNKKGFSFSKDTIWQSEFEEAFEFEETADQLRCIEEIKKDMEKDIPMDRLLCADVGYGKTEVALRACFKAVMDKKQVVILVPTTILAKQHYNTLKKRFNDFNVNIEMLSRFRTKKQQEKILSDLSEGYLDIIVGTHRVLSSDVIFKDLGLLVIDEEQRFGVKHKEKIKLLKENIDVLTLSATPIPRTLNMSLMGIRDMSIIENPPDNRFPVQIYLSEFNEIFIREAINQEILRGGQVYVLHNRVNDIEEFSNCIAEIVPNVSVRYAHGQLPEKKLESIISDFMEHKFDVLVSTSIIETGLDIKNVNTIIINNADTLGLSQLYQLKGRVGRSNRVGYAYLCYSKNKTLSDISQKRLKAIKDFSELGAGFKIAMKDLEMRGAGNLLGSKQHGNIASVGYELYTKMVEEVINKIKGIDKDVIDEEYDVLLNIKISANIPEYYIEDYSQKMDIYKKISNIKSQKDKEILENELIDRFGKIPVELENLILIGYIRFLSNLLKISEIKENDSLYYIIFRNNDSSILENAGFKKLMNDFSAYELNMNIGKKLILKWNNLKQLSKTQVLYEIIKILNYFNY